MYSCYYILIKIYFSRFPPVPSPNDSSKKLTLSSYRKRRKLRPKSVNLLKKYSNNIYIYIIVKIHILLIF